MADKEKIKKIVYSVYKKLQNNDIIVNMVNYIYIYVFPIFERDMRPCRYTEYDMQTDKTYEKEEFRDITKIKAAFICDEMTYRCFSLECDCVFLSPHNWIDTMKSFKPDLLFCESTWSGIDEYKDCWRGRVYKNNKLRFENRKVLFQILDYCKRNNVKTVFWNKEDPTFFNHEVYNFVDTAMHFDYIFTTDRECADKYKLSGHQNVEVLMFGFSPKLYNPSCSSVKEDSCIFAGSWYSDQPERCRDLENILEFAIQNKMNLKIYDRNYNTGNPVNMFPDKYKEYISKSVEFTRLNHIVKESKYAININTVTESETMFARRVFETMACNTCVISNKSKGMKQLFGDDVWFLGENFDIGLIQEKCRRNVDRVFKKHTCKKRLEQVLDTVNIDYKDMESGIAVIYRNEDMCRCRAHFGTIDCANKKGYVQNDSVFTSLDGSVFTMYEMCESSDCGYFILVDFNNISNMDIESAIGHFSYIDEDTGIRIGSPAYEYITDSSNINTVFSIKKLKTILNDDSINTKKYLI